MKSRIVQHYCAYAQHSLIKMVSNAPRCTGRLLALPVMLLDVTLETVKWPLALIESVAFTAINLLGSALYYIPLAERTLKMIFPKAFVEGLLEHSSCYDALGHVGTFILNLTWNIPTTIINAPHMLFKHIHAAFCDGLDTLKTIDDRYTTDTIGWPNTKIIYYMIGHDEQSLVIGHAT